MASSMQLWVDCATPRAGVRARILRQAPADPDDDPGIANCRYQLLLAGRSGCFGECPAGETDGGRDSVTRMRSGVTWSASSSAHHAGARSAGTKCEGHEGRYGRRRRTVTSNNFASRPSGEGNHAKMDAVGAALGLIELQGLRQAIIAPGCASAPRGLDPWPL